MNLLTAKLNWLIKNTLKMIMKSILIKEHKSISIPMMKKFYQKKKVIIKKFNKS